MTTPCRTCGQTLTSAARTFVDVRSAELAAYREAEERRDVAAFLAAHPGVATAPLTELWATAEAYAVDRLAGALYAGDDASADFAVTVLDHIGRTEWEEWSESQ